MQNPPQVFIDALNVAYWCGVPPSLRFPLTLLAQLLKAGHPAALYFDANARYLLQEEAGVYQQLMQHPQHCLQVPSGRRADGVMLRHATASGACVISRDKYRDYRKRYRRLIDDPTRLLPGGIRNDRLLVPAMAIDVPLPVSADAAWLLLDSVLAGHASPGQISPG